MKNGALTGVIIYCKICKHRKTWRCSMFHYSQGIDEYYDRTEDYMFCSEGEINDY